MRINSNANGGGRELSQNEVEWMINKGIKELDPPMVYPNPAKQIIYVDYGKNVGKEAIFNLYDLTGRVVASKTYQVQNEGNQIFSVTISPLKEGTYFYTLQVGEQIYNGKVVKMQ